MLELQHDALEFSFPEIHPEAKCTIEFQRTLRIPDDDKQYALPPGLGRFPAKHVDDYKRAPKKWVEHGGIMIPMYQSEALWINFHPHYIHERGHAYPFAIKIATGKISAITGKEWKKGLKKKDYVVLPEQPWLDGYVVENGEVRQFVAAPLGSGFSVEQQITGEDKHGGIQIEVFPMKAEIFNTKYPERPIDTRRRSVTRGIMPQSMGGFPGGSCGVVGVYSMTETLCSFNATREIDEKTSMNYCCDSMALNEDADMSLAAGGRMKQQIFEDPHDFDVWAKKIKQRCFIHLCNSMVWRTLTGEAPPTTPLTANDYTSHGMPWFDYYNDDPALSGTEKLKGVKSVAALQKEGKGKILPENQSVNVPQNQIKVISSKQVTNGKW